MVKVLMNKTFFDLDFEFYQKFPEVSNTCGCTGLAVLLIESKAYVFSLGDCKGFIFRNETIYQMSLDHLPVFIE
jgi:serine/threonine protein phosphatase PrpC